MLSWIRGAWARYWASIPVSDEPDLVPDGKIIREDFRPEPIDPGWVAAFQELSSLLIAHLPDDARAREVGRLRALLKPGVTPAEALARWINKVASPSSRVGGFVSLDWKAREEVFWQARKLLAAHGLPDAWTDPVAGIDDEWQDGHARGEVPVDAPLRRFTHHLQGHGYTLSCFDVDDLVCAFAVEHARQPQVRTLCRALDIPLRCGDLPQAG